MCANNDFITLFLLRNTCSDTSEIDGHIAELDCRNPRLFDTLIERVRRYSNIYNTLTKLWLCHVETCRPFTSFFPSKPACRYEFCHVKYDPVLSSAIELGIIANNFRATYYREGISRVSLNH
jgi:hypothetical protein